MSGCTQEWVCREEQGRLQHWASWCPIWEAFQLGTSDTCRNVLTVFVVLSLDTDCTQTSSELLKLPKVCIQPNVKSSGQRVGSRLCRAQEKVAKGTGKALGKRRSIPAILRYFSWRCSREAEQEDSSF